MKRFLLALPLLLLTGAAPNWATTVTTAPNGAYVMGNPKAKVRLVEYLSFTCSHCAHFVGEASAPLKSGYIAKGNVALEMRNAVRDQFDMTASLLARCGGAARAFGNSEAIFAAQPQWMGRIETWAKANGERVSKLPVTAQLQAIASGVGLNAVMAKRGFTPAQLNACLASKPAQQAVVGMTKEAWQVRKINGTPAFLVNGVALDGPGHWDFVEPSIKAALAL